VINHGFNHPYQVQSAVQTFFLLRFVIYSLFTIHCTLHTDLLIHHDPDCRVHQKCIGTIRGYNDQIPISHRVTHEIWLQSGLPFDSHYPKVQSLLPKVKLYFFS